MRRFVLIYGKHSRELVVVPGLFARQRMQLCLDVLYACRTGIKFEILDLLRSSPKHEITVGNYVLSRRYDELYPSAIETVLPDCYLCL